MLSCCTYLMTDAVGEDSVDERRVLSKLSTSPPPIVVPDGLDALTAAIGSHIATTNGATPSYSGPSSRDPLALPLARASRAAQRADALIDDGGEEEDDISFESHPSFFYANRRIRLNDLKNINLPRLPLEPGKLRLIPALLVYLFGSPVPATTTTKSVPLLLTRWMFLCLTFLLFSFFFFLLLLSSSSTLDKLAGC